MAGADPAARAATFVTVNGRRVPIYVIAIAPPPASVATLQAIARNSGGGYYEITKSMIEAVPLGMAVPEVTRAANAAVQHAFAAQADVNAAPTVALPLGPQTEWQTASPIVGTVNLENARDITGSPLPNTVIYTPAGTKVPQRANVMITAGMALPGFEGRLRGVPDVPAGGRCDQAVRLGVRDRRDAPVGVDAARARRAEHLHDAAHGRHGPAQRGERGAAGAATSRPSTPPG